MFFINQRGIYIVLIVYVDDILLTGNDEGKIAEIKEFLHAEFTIKDLGATDFFLEIEIAQSLDGLMVSQKRYIINILQEHNMMDANPCATPIPSDCKLNNKDGVPLQKPENYRRLIGRLLYLTMTRPNLAFVVQQLSQFMSSPTNLHWKVAQRTLRYLRGTLNYSLQFPHKGDIKLEAFSNSDWGCCQDSRKSVSGYCIFLGSCLISWKTKKQSTIARSSAETEYRALASTVSELLWITYVMRDFNINIPGPITFYCDNLSTIHMVENPVHHERTKHRDIDCHFVRDHFAKGFFKSTYVNSKDQIADFFTKALRTAEFHQFNRKLNIVYPQSSLRRGCWKGTK